MKKILLLFFILPIVFARSYYISEARIDIVVNEQGLVNVVENLTYDFTGCYYTVYREIPTGVSSVTGLNSSSSDSFLELRQQRSSDYYYEFNFINPQCDKKTNVILNYNMSQVIDSYDDLSALHFMFWGPEWPYVSKLTANITFPNKMIEYWIHNSKKSYSMPNDYGFFFENEGVNSGEWTETMALFERINDNVYSTLKQGNGLELISNQENGYALIQWGDTLCLIIFFGIPLFLFFYVYNKYGREENIGYFNSAIFDVPTPDSPAVVKAILSSSDINAFIATLFDLARRKYLEICGSEKNVEIKILKDPEGLNDYENVVYLFLKKYEVNKIINWNELKTKLLSVNNSMDFQRRLSAFSSNVMKVFDRKEYYNNEGNKKFLKYSFWCSFSFFIISWSYKNIVSINMPFFNTNVGFYLFFSCILVVFLNVIGSLSLGKWTSKGRVFERKWAAFKKYLNDYSLLSQHAPQSIVIWERFLVYAIALGVADNVINVMRLKVSDISSSNLRGVYYSPMFYSSFKNSLTFSSMRSSSSSGHGMGGGHGGFGGGHGGGGGGAR
ncbi:MAG: DUF2207 domain-containing protein [Candidatus Nanoarchaeia archaeon]|jgi:uncharacterized membrane protein